MKIESHCPFRIGTLEWTSATQRSRRTLTVAVKGTFTITPNGEATIASSQDPLAGEVRWDESPTASLYAAGDFAPLKPRVDVLLVGNAYASGGKPVTSLVARVTLGDFTKALRVTGDRRWAARGNDLALGEPAPFTQMPLRWERAALGGDNPVGVDATGPRAPNAIAAPNVEAIDDGSAPGFGPLSPTWRARRKLLDESSLFWAYGFASGRAPSEPAPEKLDFAFFNAAPFDQQLAMLRGGAKLTLEGLSPLGASVTTELPAVRPQAFRVDPATGRAEEIVLRCDTLFIDVDRGLLSLTWRGIADLAKEAEVGTIVVASDERGKKLRWDDVDRKHRANVAKPAADPLAKRYDAVKGGSGDAYLPAPPVDAIALERREAEATKSVPVEARSVLPFDAKAPPTALPSRPSSPRSMPLDGDATQGVSLDTKPVTPFAVAQQRAATGAVEELSVARYYERAQPIANADAHPVAAPVAGAAAVALADADADADALTDTDAGAAAAAAAAAADESKTMALERFAAIQAALQTKGVKRADVLAANAVEDAAFRAAERHWSPLVTADRALLDRYDAAYLAAQERARRPIGVPEYARVVIGVERGEVGKALAELELQLGDLMRLQRVWNKRTSDDPKLAASLVKAVDAARKNKG